MLNGVGGWLRAWAVCLRASAAFLTFPPCFSSAGCHTERAQWFQEQRNGSARVESPFNQVMVLELDWCRFLPGGDWKSLTTLVFLSSNLLGSTDHRRPPLTVSSRAALALTSTEGLKRWTVNRCPFLQQGHVFFWNAFSGSTWLRQSYAPRRRRPPTPSIVVAHTDSTWLTPPPHPTHPSDSAQLSKQTSLLSCQPGAHRCSAWTAGGVLACGWLTVFNSSAETSSTLVNASPRTHFN